MKKLNKVIALVMFFALALSLSACSKDESKQIDSQEMSQSKEEVYDFELTLENIQIDYLSSMAYLAGVNFNSAEPTENLLELKISLEMLYKKETGEDIFDENNYVFVKDYVDVAQRYFDIDTQALEKALRESELYNEEEDKVFGVDGIGNIKQIEATDYEFENNILTVQYRYGYKYDDFIFVLNSMQIKINEDGSYKYISNIVGEIEYILDSNGNVGEYINKVVEETPQVTNQPQDVENELLELAQTVNGIWAIENDRIMDTEFHHFYIKDNKAYIDVYSIAETDTEIKLKYSSEITQMVKDADNNYHLTTSGSYINLDNGEVLVLNLGVRGDYKIDINGKEYTYFGNDTYSAFNLFMYDRDDKQFILQTTNYIVYQIAKDGAGDSSWIYIGLEDKQTGGIKIINEAIFKPGLIFYEDLIYLDANSRLCFINFKSSDDITNSFAYLDFNTMEIVKPDLEIPSEYLDNSTYLITGDEAGNTLILHAKNIWDNNYEAQDIILSVFDKDFNHISTQNTKVKLGYTKNLIQLTAKNSKLIGEYITGDEGVFLEYDYK